jgi:hypothetical protein
MEYDVIILALLLLSPFPFMAAYIAGCFGRSSWFWFLVSIPLPLFYPRLFSRQVNAGYTVRERRHL